MTTQRWTAEQRAELEKRLASRPVVLPLHVRDGRQQTADGSKAKLPQYNPVGANIGINTYYRCGTCGSR